MGKSQSKPKPKHFENTEEQTQEIVTMNLQLVQANDLYKKGVQGSEGMGPATRISYLQRALEIYGAELRKLPQGPGRLSVQRNIAMAHYRLSEVIGSSPKDLLLTLYHAKEALQGLTAVWLGKKEEERKGEWGERLEEHLLDCFRNACRAVDLACAPGSLDKYHHLDALLKHFLMPGLKRFLLQLTFCKVLQFHMTGIRALESNDFKKALRLVEYGKSESWELRSLLRGSQEMDVVFEEDIDNLEEDLEFLRFSCESVQLRFQADELFEICILQLEELNMDLVWDVLDRYKASCLSARDRDIENEAIAMSRIGRLYHKVFKLKYKAKENYRAAFELGMAMEPRDLSGADWFMETKLALEDLQRDVVREEAERKAKEREPFLEKLKEPLGKLKEASLGTGFALLDYVYMTHPPKTKYTYDKKKVTDSNVKKTLMTAITRYHPDKQIAEDMEWKILCEEITKYLTAKYETYK